MEYRSKYKAEEIEAILDAKNNTGEGVDSNLDVLFTGQLQTKEVEVSEDTTIKADEGFLGLKEVSVKVNGGGSASSIEYIDVSGADNLVKKSLTQYACYVKGHIEDYDALVAGMTLYALNVITPSPINAVSAIAIDFSNVVVMKMGDTIQSMTILQAVLQNGATQADIDSLPRITKEEFYAL